MKIKEYFKGKNCLVTGGTGLIGRQVVRLLHDAGAHVLSVSLDDLELDSRAVYVRGDLTDFQLCTLVMRNADCVFHVAGIKGSVLMTRIKPASFFVPLLRMNTCVLEACRVTGIDDVVYVSSVGAYAQNQTLFEENGMIGKPMDSFPGWAKRMGELQCEAYRIQYGLEYSIVRPTSVYGPGDSFDAETAMVIPALMARIYAGENPLVVWGDGSVVRDFLYSEDAARGIIAAMIYKTGSGFCNLGGSEDISIGELAYQLTKITGVPHEFDKTKPTGYPRRVMDITWAKEKLNWEPKVGLREGLERTWKWFTENVDEHQKKKDWFNG